jgi:hypothetical protein
MNTQLQRAESASTLICALSTILIISLIGANVLVSSASRYNVVTKQVKAWKEALYAAEAGGEIGFAEVRKVLLAPGTEFSGWTTPAASPAPTPGATDPGTGASYSVGQWNAGDTAITFGQGGSLSTKVKIDQFSTDPDGNKYYRIRAIGTAKLFGFARTGIADAAIAGGAHFAANSLMRGKGDSLLRKIDFKSDHFRATYGDGDGNGLQVQGVSNPQISRRVELIAVPQMAFTGALKVTNSFFGPGSAGVVDSYDSKNGPYTFVADNPSGAYYSDSRNGDVSVATPNFTEGGPIYGNVTTNGGNVTHSDTEISGTIDNNVPFTVPPLPKPDTSSYTTGSSTVINVPVGTSASYVYSSLTSGVTITAVVPPLNIIPAGPATTTEASVTIVVNGDVGGKITIGRNVKAKIYFTGDMSTKAVDIVNNNTDKNTVLIPANPSRAGHLQFYGISPTNGSYQTISIDAGGGSAAAVWATMYAPNGNMTLVGNPDWYGAIVAHDFQGNGNGGGNTGFHYDKQIRYIGGIPLDYQIASFMEDIR